MGNNNYEKNIPTVLVILGATGDLMRKKIAPALYHLFQKGEAPQLFKIVGFSRRPWSDADFQKYISELIFSFKGEGADKEEIEKFSKLFLYQQGDFPNIDGYKNLQKRLKEIDDSWKVCSNKLFYLAVPPDFYKTIFINLSSSGLTAPCSPEEGWTRVIVEKPFGRNFETAEKLDELLSSLFKEIQIYRIDHYLAKEILQNILAFRFSNNLFETNWNKDLIESIRISLLEKVGVEDRGAFYDGVGALKDVGQNHLLQMLALVTMEHPINFSSESIRKKRAEILSILKPLSNEEIKSSIFRAQYKGYLDIKNVAPASNTETYFKARFFLDSSRWGGVPIIIESGKKIKQKKEIVITFKHPTPCLCPPTGHLKNKLTIHLEPQEGIKITFWAKKPGYKMEIEERDFEFSFRSGGEKPQYTEEYEKLIRDCIVGDQTLFVSGDEVKYMWRFIDPIIEAWEKNLTPLEIYTPDTDEVLRKAEFLN